MIELSTAWMLGCTTGFFLGVTVAGWSRPASLRDRRSLPDWRRRFNHENPDPPPDGHHRWFINNPVQIAECGGPCSAGPSHCDCGALWLDVPKGSYGLRLDPGRVQRGNGKGGPTTPKPDWISRGQHPCSITFPDPDLCRRPTNPYTGEPVQPNPPPSNP